MRDLSIHRGTRGAPWPARSRPDRRDDTRPRLRVIGAGESWPLDPPARDGGPQIAGKCNGYPLEVRVWHARPRGETDALYHHATGTWVSVRVL